MGDLSDRKKKILKAIVDDYISNAEPIGSKTLQNKLDFKVSSATLRNEMADLETLGYLEQPHTSAGRIPTPRGYRLYVDELMAKHRLSMQEMEQINRSMQEKMIQMDRIVEQAGNLISRMSNYTAYAMTRKTPESGTILHFDILRRDEHEIVLVVISDQHKVKSTLIKSKLSVLEEDAKTLADALNTYMAGIRTDLINEEIISNAAAAGGPLAKAILPNVLKYLADIHKQEADGEVYLTGTSKLLTHPEYQDIVKAREIMEYLGDRERLSSLPAPKMPGEMQILIGPENIAKQLQESSVVMASYQLGDGMQGLIGVVGPTRMDYAKVASRLSYFAQKLQELFKEEKPEEEEQINGK